MVVTFWNKFHGLDINPVAGIPYSLNISRLSNVAKNKIFADLQTLPKCIRLYGGLNISRLKFLLMTPKTVKSAKKFPLEIFRLYSDQTFLPCPSIGRDWFRIAAYLLLLVHQKCDSRSLKNQLVVPLLY